MKIIVTYLFTTLMLFQSLHINVGDIVRVNDLIEHVQFHKENYGDNLFSFVSKHYGQDKEHHQDEKHHHEKLPFSDCSIAHTPVALSGKFFMPEFQRFDNFEKQDNFNYRISYSSIASFDIFQPPKYT
ncbi:MAG: hypothetical protein WD554_06820 [Flavobacteriaceae bacterium]